MAVNTSINILNPFRIVIMGDSSISKAAVNSHVLDILLNSIKKVSPQPEIIFFLGDMVCGGATINDQLEAWKTLVTKYFPLTMYYPVLGSHENNEFAFSNAFTHLPNEQLPGYLRTVYYIDYGSTRFIVLNSNRTCSDGSYVISSCQCEWLENILCTSDREYNFVMFHVPAFPTGHHYGECLDMNPKQRSVLLSVLDKYNVSAVFVGHEHNYCRRIINNSLSSSIYHITTGGAGSSLNGHFTDNNNVLVGPMAVYHYIILDISIEKAFLQAFDINNNLIDSCCIPSGTRGYTLNYVDDIIIPIGAKWRYLDDGSNQETSWTELLFDDSLWNSGNAELGYGDGGEATVVSYGPDAHSKYITTYFRKHFTVEDTSIYKKLKIRIQRDDGAVIYLNGKEIYRTNMPQGIILYKTLASKPVNGFEESSYENFTIDSSVLISGHNVIAVEIHQVKPSSSDISFNFQLLGNKM